jgi:hypothetical protein
VLQQRMLEQWEAQLQAAQQQWQQQEAAARSAWQQQLMQQVQQALGHEAADSLQQHMPQLLQRSSGSSSNGCVNVAVEAAAVEVPEGCQAEAASGAALGLNSS